MEYFTNNLQTYFLNILNYINNNLYNEYYNFFLIVVFFTFSLFLTINLFLIKKYKFKLFNFLLTFLLLTFIIFLSYNLLGKPFYIKNIADLTFISKKYTYVSHMIKYDESDDNKMNLYLWLLNEDKKEPYSISFRIDLKNKNQKESLEKMLSDLKKMKEKGKEGEPQRTEMKINIKREGNVPSFETELVMREIEVYTLPSKEDQHQVEIRPF